MEEIKVTNKGVTNEDRNKWTLLIFDRPFTLIQIPRVKYALLIAVGKCTVHLFSSELLAATYVSQRWREFTVLYELKHYASYLKCLLTILQMDTSSTYCEKR